MKNAALAYAQQGRRVIPLHGPKSGGKSPGKRPIPDGWQHLSVPTEKQINAWWRLHPSANIGWIMGGPDRLICLDADGPEGLAKIESWGLPETLRAQSGSGKGGHWILKVPAHQDIARILNRRVFPDLDVKCEDGQIAVAPSIHPSGGRYVWINDAPIADLPDHVYNAIAAPEVTPAASERSDWPERPEPLAERLVAAVELAETLPPAVEGGDPDGKLGHDRLFAAATEIYWGCALPKENAFRVLEQIYNPRCTPPWEGRELVQQFNHKLNQVEAKATQPWGYVLLERDFAKGLESAFATPEAPEADKAEAKSAGIKWISDAQIFAPLPPVVWCVPGLEICAGRPTMLAGYGFSGKTMSAQALLLAYAAGHPVWNKFASSGGVARHFDHEQGHHATLKRYQRLAIGHQIPQDALRGRLAVACFPDIHLNQAKAREAYLRECEGVGLVLIDALRGATPGVDENDSDIRRYIDVLSAVSDVTGTAFILIHHSGKGEGDHAGVRGSSAIFDGCGCVFELKAKEGAASLVTQIKGPAEAEGGRMAPFGLEISDVQVDNNPKAGVRAVFVEPAAPVDKYDAQVNRVLDYVSKAPGSTTTKIYENVKPGIGKSTVENILTSLDGHQVSKKTINGFEGWFLV